MKNQPPQDYWLRLQLHPPFYPAHCLRTYRERKGVEDEEGNISGLEMGGWVGPGVVGPVHGSVQGYKLSRDSVQTDATNVLVMTAFALWCVNDLPKAKISSYQSHLQKNNLF